MIVTADDIKSILAYEPFFVELLVDVRYDVLVIIFYHPMKKSLHWFALAALFLIPIFPLIVANSFFFPFITGKAFYFRILIELGFAAWVILAFFDAKYRPKITRLTIGVTLFAVIALLADLLGVNPLRSIWSNFERMEGWLVVVHLWAFYIMSTSLLGAEGSGKTLWHRWFNVSLLVASIVGIYGLVQLSGHAEIHQGGRVDASLGNAAYMAVYMLMHVGIAAYMFLVARSRKIINSGFLQWLYPILSVVFGFLLFQTATRGTTLGLIGGIMLACALYALFARKESARSRWISASVIALVIIIGVTFWANRNTAFVKNHEVLNRLGSISWSNTSGQARQFIWPMAIQGAMQRPILGWGQENFNYIFNKDYDPRMYAQEQWFDRAHSVFLDWFVASGFVGLIAYLALYVLFITAIWKRSSLTIAEKSILTGLIVGYAVHNVFVFDNLASYTFFFALLGFAGSISAGNGHSAKSSKHASTSRMNTWLEKKTFSTDAIEYIVAPIVLVALFASIYFLNVRPIQANTRLITALTACSDRTTGIADPTLFLNALDINSYMANQEIREQTLSCTGGIVGSGYPGPTKQAFFDLAVKAISDQTAATPLDARMYVLGGSFMNALNQMDKSLPLLEKAYELTPRKQTLLFQLATAYLNNNKTDQAVSVLKDAYESEKSYGEARSAYATVLILTGKEAEAKSIFFKDYPEIFQTPRIAQAYSTAKQYEKSISILKKLLLADPKNVQLGAQLAQAQYAAGQIWEATQTLQGIAKDHPDLKSQVDAMIKQMEAGK